MSVEMLVKGHYSGGADALFAQASHFSDRLDATGRLLRYTSLPAVRMEQGQSYQTELSALGLFRCKDYRIRIDHLCPQARVMTTIEGGTTIRLWQHHLQIMQTGTQTLWIDRVVIDAGAMTPIVSRFAKFMFLRHHRLRGASTVEASIGKSYRATQTGLPVFQAAR